MLRAGYQNLNLPSYFGEGGGVGVGVGEGDGFGVGLGEALGLATGSGVAVALGVGFGVGSGVGFGVGSGVGLGVGFGDGLGVGLAVGATVGRGEGDGAGARVLAGSRRAGESSPEVMSAGAMVVIAEAPGTAAGATVAYGGRPCACVAAGGAVVAQACGTTGRPLALRTDPSASSATRQPSRSGVTARRSIVGSQAEPAACETHRDGLGGSGHMA